MLMLHYIKVKSPEEMYHGCNLTIMTLYIITCNVHLNTAAVQMKELHSEAKRDSIPLGTCQLTLYKSHWGLKKDNL